MSKTLFTLALIGIAAGVWGKHPQVMPIAVSLLVLSVVVSIATDREVVQHKNTHVVKNVATRPASSGEKVKKSA